MKKIILLLILLFLTSFNKGFCGVNIQSTGSTTIGTNYASTPIRATISVLLSLTLTMKVKCLDQFITSTTDPSIQIPVSQLYLNDGVNEFQMAYNTQVTTINGLAIGVLGYIVNYNCIIKNVVGLPPGVYTTRLQFETNTTLSPDTAVYTLQFVVPTDQDLTVAINPSITLFPDDVFNGNAVIDNTITPQVVIKSNDKWKLILDTTGLGTLQGDYYFLITGVSPNVTSYITTQTKIQPNQQYVLASGNPTVAAPIIGPYTTDYINIKYTLKNTSGVYIHEGIYNNYGTYSIQRGN